MPACANLEAPLEAEGMREAAGAGRPAEGLRGLEAADGLGAGALGRLEPSPLEGREPLFPELGDRAGILEAGKEGEVGLKSPPAFLALPLACKQRRRGRGRQGQKPAASPSQGQHGPPGSHSQTHHHRVQA